MFHAGCDPDVYEVERAFVRLALEDGRSTAAKEFHVAGNFSVELVPLGSDLARDGGSRSAGLDWYHMQDHCLGR